MYNNNIIITVIIVVIIFFFTGVTYLLVYRTDKYKKLTAEVEKDSKKCE